VLALPRRLPGAQISSYFNWKALPNKLYSVLQLAPCLITNYGIRHSDLSIGSHASQEEELPYLQINPRRFPLAACAGGSGTPRIDSQNRQLPCPCQKAAQVLPLFGGNWEAEVAQSAFLVLPPI